MLYGVIYKSLPGPAKRIARHYNETELGAISFYIASACGLCYSGSHDQVEH